MVEERATETPQAGEGLISLKVIECIGPSLRVSMTDISLPLLRHAEIRAAQRGVRDQGTFLECPAENLPAIVEASVARSVLAYVTDKRAVLHEFSRVVRPGGADFSGRTCLSR